jgi:hypothetical protein
MAHLAHMLRLPCFLIDWKLPSPSTTLGEFHCDFVHRSETVYIVRDDEELFGWDADKFAHMVFLLNQGQTNNRLVNGSHRIEFVNDRIYNDIKVVETLTNNTVLTAESIFGDNDASKLVSKYYWTKMPKSI